MIGRITYFLAALGFIALAVVQFFESDPWLWIFIFIFPAICSILAQRRKLPYVVILVGFVGFLFLLTYHFPPIEKFHYSYTEGRRTMGLMIGGNYIAILGIVKLYRESYL